MLIAVDFDGTIVEHCYPKIGKEMPFATDTLRRLIAERHRLILWTIRKGSLLEEALDWCKARGVEFYAVNRNFPEEEIGDVSERKIKVDMVIDNRNIGGLPDWGVMYELIHRNITYKQYISEMLRGAVPQQKKKHWWQ